MNKDLYLPNITPEIKKQFESAILMIDGQWTQDAVDFLCFINPQVDEILRDACSVDKRKEASALADRVARLESFCYELHNSHE